MFCAKCGKEMDDNAKFCPSCGADSTAETVEQPQASYVSDQPESSASSGLGVGAMICGIIGLVLSWVPILGLILSIVATVLGSKRKTLPPDKRGMATAGFVMGIIGMVIGIIILIFLIVAVVFLGSVASWALGSFL